MNNRGSTMVEILVAFVVLSVIMASLVGIISLSSNMEMESVDMIRVQEEFKAKYYSKTRAAEGDVSGLICREARTGETGNQAIALKLYPTNAQGTYQGSYIPLDAALYETYELSDPEGIVVYTARYHSSN